MSNVEHLGRLLVVLVPSAAAVRLCAWLVRRRFALETSGSQRGIVVGGIAGLLAGFRLADDLQRAALVSGAIVVAFFGIKVLSDVLSKQVRGNSHSTQ